MKDYESIYHTIKEKYKNALRKIVILNFFLLILIVFLLVTAFFANEKLYHYVFNKITVPSVLIHE